MRVRVPSPRRVMVVWREPVTGSWADWVATWAFVGADWPMWRVKVIVSPPEVMMTWWSPKVRVVGWCVQLPVESVVVEVEAESMVMVTDEEAVAEPWRRGLSERCHHSVRVEPEVEELPMAVRERA